MIRKLVREGVLDSYEAWRRQRDSAEVGFHCLVKLICYECGRRWVESVRLTLPPCPKCGSDEEVYECDTLQVG